MHGFTIPQEDLDILATYLDQGLRRGEILALTGWTIGAFQRRQARLEQINGDEQETPTTEGADPIEVARLRDANRRLKAKLAEIARDELTDRDVRKYIFGLAAETPEPPAWTMKTGKAGGSHGVPVTTWSDWHLGEVVRLSETNGVNEFNLEIAERRIQTLVERIVDIVFNHMTGSHGPGIVVNLGGDMVSGGIHPELAESDDDELFPVILWAVERIAAALKLLADKFGRVFCPSVPGNHGRVFDRKPRAKRYVHRNADWLIYCLLERHFQAIGDKRVQFFIPDTGEALYRVYGHRYMLTHGDDLGVKGGDGIIGAIGPVMRGELKMRGSSAQIGRDYDTLLGGHWHQFLWLPRYHVNNTLKGYDEYARRMLRAPATAPGQMLWFTHPKRGITARWEIQLGADPRQGSRELPGWVGWPEAA